MSAATVTATVAVAPAPLVKPVLEHTPRLVSGVEGVPGRELRKLVTRGHAFLGKGERDQHLRSVTELANSLWSSPHKHKNRAQPRPRQSAEPWRVRAGGALLALAGTRSLARSVLGKRRPRVRLASRGFVETPALVVNVGKPADGPPRAPERDFFADVHDVLVRMKRDGVSGLVQNFTNAVADLRGQLLHTEHDPQVHMSEVGEVFTEMSDVLQCTARQLGQEQKARQYLERMVDDFQAERDEALAKCDVKERNLQELLHELKQLRRVYSARYVEDVTPLAAAAYVGACEEQSESEEELNEEALAKLEESGALKEMARKRLIKRANKKR